PARSRVERLAGTFGAATPSARRAAGSARPTPTPRATPRRPRAGNRRNDRSLLLRRRLQGRGLFELLDADRDDLDLDLRENILVQPHLHVVRAEALDGMGELDAAFVDFEAFRVQRV